MAGDWFKAYRQTVDSAIFADANVFKVAFWCMARANYSDCHVPISTGRGLSIVELKRGQFLFGRKSAAKELKMPENSVVRRMKKLESLSFLTLKAGTHFSIVTVLNYSTYQDDARDDGQASGQATGTQRAGNSTTNGQATGTDKKDNNTKEGKEEKEKQELGAAEVFRPQAQFGASLTVDQLSLPSNLDTEPVKAELSAWFRHCSEKRIFISLTSFNEQLCKELAAWGPEKTIESIRYSRFKNCTGIYEAKAANADSRTKQGIDVAAMKFPGET